jgi:hypothetical protein
VVPVCPTVLGGTVVVGAVVLGSTVVLAAVVVGGTVGVGVVVLGSTVWLAAVTVGGVVVTPSIESAPVVVAVPTAGAVAPAGSGTYPGTVVVVEDVDAGSTETVGSAPPDDGCGGTGCWGTRLAEATTAARTAAVSPKARSSGRQGGRGLARCRGGGVGIAHRPGSTRFSGRMDDPATHALPSA